MAFTKINAAGIGTTETVTVDGLTVINDGSFGGNLSVGGTITYEDVTNVDSVGIITARAGVLVGSGITLSKDGDGFFTGIVTATSFSGDGSALTGITQTTINSNTNNYLITGTGSANTLQGEANLTFNGGATGDAQLTVHAAEANANSDSELILETSNDFATSVIMFKDSTAEAGSVAYNHGDNYIKFSTNGTNGGTERVRIDSSGRLLLGTTTEGESTLDDLTIANSGDCGITIRSGTSSNGAIGFSDGTSGADEYRGIIDYDHNGDDLKFYTNATEKIRIDSSGRLMIGTTTEGEASADNLTVAGSGHEGITIRSGTSHFGSLFFSDGTSGTDEYKGAVEYNHNGDYLYLRTAATERFRIDSSGKVAIGNASPQQLLHVWPDTANTTSAYIRVTSGDRGSGTGVELGSDADGDGRLNVVSNAKLKLYTNNTQRFTIDESGRLFLGLTTLSYPKKLNVQGESGSVLLLRNHDTTSYAADTNTSIEFALNTGNTGNQNGSCEIRAFKENGTNGNNARALSFYTAGNGASPAERCRITSDGHFLFSRTNTTIDHNNFGTGIYSGGEFKTSRAVTAASVCAAFYGAQGYAAVKGDGDLENTHGRYGSLSDETLKENIVDANSQWNDIKNIKIRNFNFKESTGYATHKQIGVIAQELETVCPNLVDENDQGIKAVASSVLYMKAVKALQEAIAKIETLEAKVAALEG